jgi:DNA-binding IclR family transcriptional regulator
MKEDPQFITALSRGLDVLRCFTVERVELGTTDIARLTGLPQPTVWRLCYTLSKLGYLTPGKDPERLRIGSGVLALGVASIIQNGVADMAYPLLSEIAHEFNASVTLGARDGLQMLVVQRVEAPSVLRLNFHVGTLLEIERSALGAAYLCGIAADERAELMASLERARPEPSARFRARCRRGN